jgi:acetoin utilization deacetylase AcuC-like enzyme
MSTGFVWLENFAWHDTGNWTGTQPFPHPESPESKSRFAGLVEVSGLGQYLVRLPVAPAGRDDLLRVHTAEHVDRVIEASAQVAGGDAGDSESPFGQGAYEIALLAAGGTMSAVRAVMDGTCTNAYALVRPPGHHAVRTNGMGYCIFANIAIAIEWSKLAYGVGRIAVVDWDVHHGNGTQDIFYEDPSVLTISIHQDSLFPFGSGPVSETGADGARGTNINVPLPAGSGNGAYVHAIAAVAVPALQRYKPELILVASGFDASAADPLGRMMVTSNGYRQMTAQLMSAAAELCDGRLVMSHEGGYSPTYVPFCGLAVLEEMSRQRTDVMDTMARYFDPLAGQELTAHQAVAVEAAIPAVAQVPRRGDH